jgi:signal transduction histidine kinase
MSPLIHLANVLYLVSYVLKDILWLRIVAVLGSLCVLVAIAVTPNPRPESIAWNVLFFAINVVQIKLLILERRPVQLSRDDDHACIVVRDTGPGIAEHSLGTLFDRYVRADETQVGSGLGLMIVKQIVEAHGGRLGVRSKLGEGSSFWFRLPLAG